MISFGGASYTSPKFEPELRRKGSAPAPGAVFRALAENNERNKKVPVRPGILVSQTAGREARPATPEAGVLPAYKLPVEL
jgi:hypothetical protein